MKSDHGGEFSSNVDSISISDSDNNNNGKVNVVIFPFMAQGHIIPFLALALRIERLHPDYAITFVNTPLNIAKLRRSLPPESAVVLEPLPFRITDHGLPPDSENTDSLPYDLVHRLLQASLTLRPSFAALLRRLRPAVVVSDIFFGWTAALSRDLGAFHVVFSGCGGFGLASYCSLWLHLHHRRQSLSGGNKSFSLLDFPEAGTLHVSQLPKNIAEADGTDPWSIFQDENISGWWDSDGFLFNTVEGLDRSGLDYFRRKFGLPVWAVGPILLPEECRPKMADRAVQVMNWLESKEAGSVLYVSFGSMNTISAGQTVQLAEALERSGQSFLWVARPPTGSDINLEFDLSEWLPGGFAGRVGERGLVVPNWGPQVEILGHAAVGGFLSHCGWNSVLEAVSEGVPILGWPMAAEQFFNAAVLERDVGVCLEVARGKVCEVDVEGLVDKIRLVLMPQSALRRKALEAKAIIQEAIRDTGSSARALDGFFTAAIHRNK